MKPLNVLVPLDGSQFSHGLVTHICRLLNPQDHQLMLLRVADEPIGVIGQSPRQLVVNNVSIAEYPTAMDIEQSNHPIYANQQREANRAALYSDLVPVARDLEARGYLVKTEVRFGDPVGEIVACCRSEHIDLVVLGTHGRTGFRRVALGSVTTELLRATSVPTLVVKLIDPISFDEQLAELLS